MIKKLFFASLISIIALFTFTSTVSAVSELDDDDIPSGGNTQINEDPSVNCVSITAGVCTKNGNSCYKSGGFTACKETRTVASLPDATLVCVISPGTPTGSAVSPINNFCGSIPRIIETPSNNRTCNTNIQGQCKNSAGEDCYQAGRFQACKRENNHVFPATTECVITQLSVSPRSTDSTDRQQITNFCEGLTQREVAQEPATTPGGSSGGGSSGGGSSSGQNGGSYQGDIPVVPDSDGGSSSSSLTPHQSTYRDETSAATFTSDCRYLLGFTSWDCNVTIGDETTLQSGVWQIALNILTNISVIATYLVLGYVIYGGYLYTMSGGSSEKTLAGKKTLARAFTGLAIVTLANVIMTTIRFVLVGANGSFTTCISEEGCVTPANMITNTIHWTIAVASIVAVAFIIYGGISFMTSAGDPGKVKKAKDMLLYSSIGLVIVALAEIITAFVTNIINNAS